MGRAGSLRGAGDSVLTRCRVGVCLAESSEDAPGEPSSGSSEDAPGEPSSGSSEEAPGERSASAEAAPDGRALEEAARPLVPGLVLGGFGRRKAPKVSGGCRKGGRRGRGGCADS